MKTEIPSVLLDEVRRNYHAAPGRSMKKAVVETAAKHFGISYSQMNRKLDLQLRTRAIPQSQAERVAKKNELARTVYEYVEQKQADSKKCSVKNAYEYLMMTGGLPGWFTRKDCYGAIERLKLKNVSLEKTQRFIRFERDEPMSMYQADFTKSDFLKVVGREGGPYELQMTDGRWSRTENRMYAWIGVVIDDMSRVHFAQYMISVGEDAFLAQELLVAAMQKKDALLLQGMPRELYFDRGPGFKTLTAEGLRAFGIQPIVGSDFEGTNETNKQARGKIERLIRFIKDDFERKLNLLHGKGHRFTLQEANALLAEWSEWQNQQAHPTREHNSKWNFFKRGLHEAHFPPKDALAYFSVVNTATVKRRLIKTGKADYWQAPAFLDEGLKIEYTLRRGECFLVWKGEEVKLVPHSRSAATKAKEIGKTKHAPALDVSEKDSDAFMGPLLKERFDRELKEITAGELSLRDLSADDYEDIRGFFRDAHSVAEIREVADGVKMRVLMPAHFDAIAEREPKVAARGNIIQYNPKDYE